MGFVIPFKDNLKSTNPLVNIANDYVEKGYTPVSWNFTTMKVLEFAFDSRDGSGNSYLPHNYPRNCVVYTGTHDNDTILGWMTSAPPADVAAAKRYLRLNRREGYHWGMEPTS